MLAMRSTSLENRSNAVKKAVMPALPKGCKLEVEPIVYSETRDRIEGINVRNRPASVLNPENPWKPTGGVLLACHVNVTNESGETMVRVVVNPFLFGKPNVKFRGDKNRELAEEITNRIRSAGKYIFKPRVEEGIEPAEWEQRIR